jgi:hypothetical protein
MSRREEQTGCDVTCGSLFRKTDCVSECPKAFDTNRMLSVGRATKWNGRSGFPLPVGTTDLLSPFTKTSGPLLGPKELPIQ